MSRTGAAKSFSNRRRILGCAYRFHVSLGFAVGGVTVAMHSPFMPKTYMAFLSEVQMDCSQLHQAQLAFQRCSVAELISHCAYMGRWQACIGYIWKTSFSSFPVPSYYDKLADTCLGHEIRRCWKNWHEKDLLWQAGKHYMVQMLEGLPATEHGLAKLLISTRISYLRCHVDGTLQLYGS